MLHRARWEGCEKGEPGSPTEAGTRGGGDAKLPDLRSYEVAAGARWGHDPRASPGMGGVASTLSPGI